MIVEIDIKQADKSPKSVCIVKILVKRQLWPNLRILISSLPPSKLNLNPARIIIGVLAAEADRNRFATVLTRTRNLYRRNSMWPKL